jgi:hypothetical protein
MLDLIRITSKAGTKRLYDIKSTWKIKQILESSCKEFNLEIKDYYYLSLDPQGKEILDKEFTVRKCKLSNGSRMYLQIGDDLILNSHVEKKITQDGNIVNKTLEEIYLKQGFRPGLQSLSTIKNQWTLTDFKLMDNQFEYVIKAQKESICKKLNIAPGLANDFQSYLRKQSFHQYRLGYLYGTVDENKVVKVFNIYEPLQENLEILEDSNLLKVEKLAQELSLVRVGCILGIPSRTDENLFTGSELLSLALQQFEHNEKQPFVIIRVTMDKSNVQMDSFELSQQFIEIVKKGAIIEEGNISSNLKVEQQFTAIVEGKRAQNVDINFFLINVPIGYECESKFVYKFPKFNRDDDIPTVQHVKNQLREINRQGWTFESLLLDFHLLLFLMTFIGDEETLELVRGVLDNNISYGHKILLQNF